MSKPLYEPTPSPVEKNLPAPRRWPVKVIFLRDVPRAEEPAPRSYWPLVMLMIITAFGGALRLYRLDVPTLWTDEVQVYWRVCGTYGQLLQKLRTDGFPPLHYSMMWALRQFTPLTPFYIRLVPAIAGTLTIPAMYFLARQMLPRSTSLLAAALVACSAFSLFYSRDAKMYSHTWLFVTLNTACLLWWFRTWRSTAWLCWIASGCVMVGLHASALILPAVAPLLFLTQRKVHWRNALLLVVGGALIAAGPAGYYLKFNHFVENVEDRGWGATGIGWLAWFNGDRTGPQYVQYTGTSFLMGYEWPRPEYVPAIPEPLVTAPQLAAMEITGLLALGAIPWPRVLRRKTSWDGTAESPWRVLLWLGFWIMLPAYAFYCHSVKNFVSPMQWLSDYQNLITFPGAIAIDIILATFAVAGLFFKPMRAAAGRLIQYLLVGAALFGLCIVIFHVCFSAAAAAQLMHRPWRSIWTPRYLGFTWPAVMLAVAILLMRLPTRALRVAAIVFVLGVNLGMASLRVTLQTEPPIDQMAADVFASQPANANVRTYLNGMHGDNTVAGGSIENRIGHYYLQMHANFSPITPDEFMNLSPRFRYWHDQKDSAIAREVKASATLSRIVIWDQLDMRTSPRADRLITMLPGWRLIGDDYFNARIYWDWRDRWKFHRREYVRTSSKG